MYTNNSNCHSWPWMHPHPTDQLHPLPPPLFVDPFVMQQLLELQAKNMPRHEGRIWHSYISPFCIGSVYLGMAQQYRAPSSGLSRNQHSKGIRKTEAQCLYQISHELSGAIARDHSTSTHRGHAQIGTRDNPGAGRARTPPSRNPSMVDHNSTQQMRITRDKRYHHPRSRRRRTDKVDPSMYEIPIVNFETGATAGDSSILAINPAMPLRIGQIDIDVPCREHKRKFEFKRTVSRRRRVRRHPLGVGY